MNNLCTLVAQIKQIKPLRYTPAGMPVLELILQHQSWQQECGEKYLAKFEISAKIIGQQALQWQDRQGEMVNVQGFLAQRNKNYPYPVLRIENIQEYKG